MASAISTACESVSSPATMKRSSIATCAPIRPKKAAPVPAKSPARTASLTGAPRRRSSR